MARESHKHKIIGIIGDLTFSKTDVYLWVRIPPTLFEFLEYKERESEARKFDLALANLMSSEEKNREFQLIVSTKPFDVNDWGKKLWDRRKVQTQTRQEVAYAELLNGMMDRLENLNFSSKNVYLGLRLGRRSEFSDAKNIIPFGDVFSDLLNGLVGVQDEHVSEKEITYWNTRAKTDRDSLRNSYLKTEEVEPEELAYLIRKQFFPAMKTPSIEELSVGNKEKWGEGEIHALVDAEIVNNPKYLQINQMVSDTTVKPDGTLGTALEIQTGYRATLCVVKFPETLLYPERHPWIHLLSGLYFPVDFYSRFTLEPSRKVRREVDNKLKSTQDQARNQISAGGAISLQVQEQLAVGEDLEYALSKSTVPWVYGRHRIIVTAPTEELLRERCAQIIDNYRSLDIQVIWPTGDQFSLLLESLPSDKVRLTAYKQQQELSIFSVGVPSGVGSVGDRVTRNLGKEMGWLGSYLGYTTGNTIEPVFLSVHSAIAQNNPPGLVITGAPGGGKSFCAFTLTYQMALSGIWTIYIDPKGDALPLMNLPGMEENARLLDLKDGNDGILDPFSVGQTPQEQQELALETIGLLAGGASVITSQQKSALAKAIRYTTRHENPSLNKVVDLLLSSKDIEAESLGQTLDLIRELPFARLCFAPKQAESLKVDKSLTIITLLGLDLPSALLKPENYNNSNRLAVAVMYLLTSFTRRLMMNMNKSQPKAIAIDEAWAVTSTPQGQKLVLEVARMGRSLNTGLILVSQNAGDFLGEGVTNSVSTRVAYASRDTDEIKNVLRFFNLPHTDVNEEIIRNLRTGECLIKDAHGRIARVQVDAWNEQMSDAFETNPEKRKS